jgi:nicotinate-nucleotide adenylyltransferase
MLRLGVFGGSFDPVHRGHLHVALLAREAAGLDRVLFVPAARPPHKERSSLTEARHRVAMLRAALLAEPDSECSEVELGPHAPRFTADTLDTLQELHPAAELHFILGMDSLLDLPAWKDPERILGRHKVIAVDRPGLPEGAGFGLRPGPGDETATGGETPLPDILSRCRLVGDNPFAISATLIRRRVEAGLSIRHLVPAPVESYILTQGLYRSLPENPR